MQAVMQRSRSLRKHAPNLVRDALAVLTCLRPAVMLDYVVLDAPTLRAINAVLYRAAPSAGVGFPSTASRRLFSCVKTWHTARWLCPLH